MNGNELIRRLRKIARRRGEAMTINQNRGKGSHATLSFGNRLTTIKDLKKEIGKGLHRSMLKDLGLDERDI